MCSPAVRHTTLTRVLLLAGTVTARRLFRHDALRHAIRDLDAYVSMKSTILRRLGSHIRSPAQACTRSVVPQLFGRVRTSCPLEGSKLHHKAFGAACYINRRHPWATARSISATAAVCRNEQVIDVPQAGAASAHPGTPG